MLSIHSILEYILTNLSDPRYHKIDEDHIVDSKTGVKIHMYDDWFKLTKDDNVIATMGDFTTQEQESIWAIKQAVVDPVKDKEKRDNYKNDMINRRLKLSALFENPEPLEDKEVVAEADTETYQG